MTNTATLIKLRSICRTTILSFVMLMFNSYVSGQCIITMTSVDASCGTCADGSATGYDTLGTGPYFYLWDDPGAQTTQTAINLVPGVYCVTLTDSGNGCVITGLS